MESQPSKQHNLSSAPQFDEELATLAKAVGHPLRVRILRILAERSCVCGQLVELLPVAQSTVSEHLRILKEAGLVIGDVQPPRTCYCLASGSLDRLAELTADLAALVIGSFCTCPPETASQERAS